ncbi:MAG: sigma 54-interacting transcriptional regulator, partial [Kiritimatiellae bacterium]|nr:sigma 54-interacting transcriptional regulator [Kiritimatiellia bacterium]
MMGSSELKLSMVVRNMIEYPPVERAQEGRKMDRCDSLILTGWGYAEYVASAAVALKALNGEAEVLGVSRRRLPELMEEISERKKSDRWSSIYLLGVSLFGDPERLAAALGTLFLDEIGEMSIEVQAILLRVLEGGRFMRVGGKEELRCDVRLVTATNRDLPTLVREGRFREDLYQRLNVVQMRTPSLREHKDDIPIIANAWWRKFHGNRT